MCWNTYAEISWHGIFLLNLQGCLSMMLNMIKMLSCFQIHRATGLLPIILLKLSVAVKYCSIYFLKYNFVYLPCILGSCELLYMCELHFISFKS